MDSVQQKKRDRFKVLFIQRVKNLVKRHKQLLNLANQSNYKFTEDEAKQAVRLYELMLDGAKEKWTDVESYPLVKIDFDKTELD
mgnify:FL=1|tara:strand:- start:1645 stop:1896 length:252 start_codon:yes stop_codon:yes gene_type:complete